MQATKGIGRACVACGGCVTVTARVGRVGPAQLRTWASQEISLRSRREGDLGSVALADLVAAAARANQDRSAGLPLG